MIPVGRLALIRKHFYTLDTTLQILVGQVCVAIDNRNTNSSAFRCPVCGRNLQDIEPVLQIRVLIVVRANLIRARLEAL